MFFIYTIFTSKFINSLYCQILYHDVYYLRFSFFFFFERNIQLFPLYSSIITRIKSIAIYAIYRFVYRTHNIWSGLFLRYQKLLVFLFLCCVEFLLFFFFFFCNFTIITKNFSSILCNFKYFFFFFFRPFINL